MAKKKVIETQSLEAVEPVGEDFPTTTITSLELSNPIEAEPMFTIRSRGRFIDGGLANDFKQYGYTVNWKNGEVRYIPAWLYKKCLDSGGRFDVE